MAIIRLTILFLLFLFSKVNAQHARLEDLEFLKRQVEKTVPLYQIAERQEAFDRIYTTILHNEEDLAFGVQRLLNTLEDEGCNVPLFQAGLNLEILPIKTYFFEEGLYILSASEAYASFVGKQIVGINNLPVEEVFNRLKPLINADNDYYKSYLFQAYGLMPSMLKAAGIANSDSNIELQFSDGKRASFKADEVSEYGKLSRNLPNDGIFQYSSTNHKGENYWMEFLPDTHTLFVQLKRVANSEDGASFNSFVDGIEDQIKEGKAKKIVLDLRYGGGGNGFKLKQLTDLLGQSELNESGKLFVLTSNATRGTLLELASILRLNSKAIIMGQPTAEGPNTVGDTKYITLPNSGLHVSLTHTLWPTTWEQDRRSFLPADQLIKFSFSEYEAGKDPWVAAVHNYENTTERSSVPRGLQSKLEGNYTINGRKVSIKTKNGRLFLSMNRKMKSFFEIHTELYLEAEGLCSSDIEGVYLKYDPVDLNVLSLEWDGFSFEVT